MHAPATAVVNRAPRPLRSHVLLASHLQEGDGSHPLPAPDTVSPEAVDLPPPRPLELLEELEAWAIANNPTLRRMQEEAAAAWAKTGYVDQLPDPSLGTMVFAPPMHYDPDRQLAELQIMQMIPWLGRLKAEARQTQMEALAAENAFRAERLQIIGDIRANWFKLYVLGKQIEATEADQAQLQSLIQTANARIATGDAQPGDVLMATLELSSLQEQLLNYRQQVAATTAELNRLLGRGAGMPITPPASIEAELPEWNHDLLREIAFGSQPALIAARLRTAAARWGIEVARLERRPDLTLGANWMISWESRPRCRFGIANTKRWLPRRGAGISPRMPQRTKRKHGLTGCCATCGSRPSRASKRSDFMSKRSYRRPGKPSRRIRNR
jgi:outer membrane protein TolC